MRFVSHTTRNFTKFLGGAFTRMASDKFKKAAEAAMMFNAPMESCPNTIFGIYCPSPGRGKSPIRGEYCPSPARWDNTVLGIYCPSPGRWNIPEDVHENEEIEDENMPPLTENIEDPIEPAEVPKARKRKIAKSPNEELHKIRKPYVRRIALYTFSIKSNFFYDANFTMPFNNHGNAWEIWPEKQLQRDHCNHWAKKAKEYAMDHPNVWHSRSHLGIDANLRGQLAPSQMMRTAVPLNTWLSVGTLYLTQIDSQKWKHRTVFFCVLE